MTWQNPWALLGLVALAMPVFIHLLSRKRAVLQKFPSLRFLNATRLLPTRSPHLTDIPLLMVRLAILLLATLALMQPLWISAARRQSLNATVARVIIVDTSASMMRAVAGGRSAADSARGAAQLLVAEAQASLVVETATPAHELAGASAWLRAQGTRGEVVMLSDFQHGTVDVASLARVAPGTGVRLVRVPSVAPVNTDSGFATTHGRVVGVADSVTTRAEWSASASHAADTAFVLLAPAAARLIVDAAAQAALDISPRGAADSAKQVAIMFDGAAEQQEVVQSAKAPAQAWMAPVMMAVQQNKVLSQAAAASPVTDTTIAAPFAVILRTQQGRPVVYAAQASVSGTERLVLIHRGDASNLTTPALLAAAGKALEQRSSVAENERLTITDAELRTLERAPGEQSESAGDQAAANRTGLSDGRWFWLAALLLLGLETWLRRKVDANVQAEAA